MPAIAGLAAIDVVAVALVALLLMVALFPLYRPLLEGAFTQVPLIGGWLSLHVAELLDAAYASAVGTASQAVQPLADAIARARWFLQLFPKATVDAVYALWWALGRLHWQTLPQLEQAILSLVAQRVYQAELYAQDLAQRVEREAHVLYGLALDQAGRLAYTAELYAQDLAQRVEAVAAALFRQAQADLVAAEGRMAAYTQQAAQQAEGYALQLAGDVASFAQAAVLDAELLGRLEVQQAEDYARLLHDLANGYAAGLVGALAATVAVDIDAVGTAVRAIEDSPCQRFCDPLGQVGALLQGLEDAGLLALVLALISEARSHPHEVTTAIDSALAGPAREALSGIAG